MIGIWIALHLQGELFPTTLTTIEGWTVHVQSGLAAEHPEEWEKAERLLTQQLCQIERKVADEPLKKLKEIPIWINWNDPGTACMAYHPDARYLSEHKMNPSMAKGIEIGNVKNFLSWTHEQPWMVLHELAHGYHYLFLEKSWENPEVKAAYDAAMKAKLYDSVLHWNGKKVKHYAENNPMEFFAESSEAYFGTNDFYPFVNAELKTYDPATFALMRRVWGDPAHKD